MDGGTVGGGERCHGRTHVESHIGVLLHTARPCRQRAQHAMRKRPRILAVQHDLSVDHLETCGVEGREHSDQSAVTGWRDDAMRWGARGVASAGMP